MGTLALQVSYDGTAYHGYQRQIAQHEPTVQGVLEAALLQLCGEAVTTAAAGRTDAGVHASGQVVTFTTERQSHLSLAIWRRALNALLPEGVAVRNVALVAPSVHARYSALARAYRYRVFSDSTRDPLRERYALRVGYPLARAPMQEACDLILGERDFAAFGQSPSNHSGQPRKHTVRTLLTATIAATGDEITFDFAANGFLRGMVRRMVGTLLLVGAGRLTPTDVASIVAACKSEHPGAAAPPHGLCLVHVEYPPGTIAWPANLSLP